MQGSNSEGRWSSFYLFPAAALPFERPPGGNAESKAGDFLLYLQNLETKDIKACPQCFCMFVLSGGKNIKKFFDRGFLPVAPVVA